MQFFVIHPHLKVPTTKHEDNRNTHRETLKLEVSEERNKGSGKLWVHRPHARDH